MVATNDKLLGIRTWCSSTADRVIIGVAAALPWSTSLTILLIILWLVLTLATITVSDFRRELLTLAGSLPVALACLAVLSTSWADVGWSERLGGADGFYKLLAIPLLLAQFRRSQRSHRVLIGYLVSCTVLLVLSWISISLPPNLTVLRARIPGVPVRDVLTQSLEFIFCAFVLLFIAIEFLRNARLGEGFALFALALLFLSDVLYLQSTQTWFLSWFPPTLIVLVLFFLLVHQRVGIKAVGCVLVVGVIVCAGLWNLSPDVQRAARIVWEKVENDPAYLVGAERAKYWPISLTLIRKEPLLGHGAGSVRDLFARQTGQPYVPSDPFQQTLSLGIQLGLIGVALLWAMWLWHGLIFRGASLLHWAGLIVVIECAINSLWVSPLTGFAQGWTYVLFVGVMGGMTNRERSGGWLEFPSKSESPPLLATRRKLRHWKRAHHGGKPERIRAFCWIGGVKLLADRRLVRIE